MKNILIILVVHFFLVSCIDIIKSSDEEFYESVHIQGSGWFEFYENNENENLEIVDDFTLQIWFSGQEDTSNEAPCIASLKGNTSTISIYRNPNINNMIMIYEDNELIRQFELNSIDLSQHTNFYLLSIIKIQNQIIIYINDTVIKEEETIENGSWDWVDLNNDNLYNQGEGEEFVDEENGVWDEGEEFTDENENGMYDQAEEFVDGNNAYDEGEEFIDENENGMYDQDEEFVDEENGVWDEGEEFTDENENGMYDQAEEFVDGNNAYDDGEEFVDTGMPLVIINNDILQSIIGANINSNNIPTNLWYGYIDELRLWNAALHDTMITFHTQYPTKISSSHDDPYLNNNLNGLWDFKINMGENSFDNVFQDIDDKLIYTIIYTLESMSNELSEIGR